MVKNLQVVSIIIFLQFLFTDRLSTFMSGSGIITDPLLKPSGISYRYSWCNGFHCFSWQQTSCALLHSESHLSLISNSTPHSLHCQLISVFLGFQGSPLPLHMAYCLNSTAYTVEQYQNNIFIFFPAMSHIFLVSLCAYFSIWCMFSLYCKFCPPKRMLFLEKSGLRVLYDSTILSSADCQAQSSLSQITVWRSISLSSLSDYHLWSNHHLLKWRLYSFL